MLSSEPRLLAGITSMCESWVEVERKPEDKAANARARDDRVREREVPGRHGCPPGQRRQRGSAALVGGASSLQPPSLS